MNEKQNYRILQWASFGLILTIAITISFLYFDSLALSAFKLILAVLLVIAFALLLLLQKAVRRTIEGGKQRFKNAELKFSRLYASDIIGVIITSLDGQVLEANDHFLKLLGYKRNDLTSGNIRWDRSTPEEFNDISRKAIEQLQEHGSCQPFEKQYFRKDGSRIWVLVAGSRLAESENVTAMTYVIDISNKRESEERSLKLQTIIKQQQEEFKSVFMNAPALISIKRGPELRYDFVNKAIMELSGRDDHLGKTTEEMYGSSIKSQDAQISIDVYNTGLPKKGSRHKLSYLKDDIQTEIYLDYILTPVYDYDGKVDGVATFGFDVTDLVKANQEMEISKNRFSYIAESLPYKILLAKTNGVIEYMNDTWLSYLHLTPSDTERLEWETIIHPEDIAEMYKRWRDAVDAGLDFNMEIRFRRGDGSFRLHSTRSIPLKDSSGEIVSWLGTSVDIHDQQEQLKEIAESEIYFRTMADDSPFMIWKSDTQGRCIYVNKTWERITGLTFQESLEFGYLQVLETAREQEKENWLSAVYKQMAYQSKLKLRQHNGELRWVLAQSNPYYIEGKFSGYIGSIADITDQEMASLALKELSDKKDEFISIASHELKTPLTSVKGFTQILLKNLDKDSNAYQFGSKIHEHTIRLEGLITSLLDVSKINAGKVIYMKSRGKIVELISESVDNVKYVAQDRKITIEGLPDVEYYGDKFRLEQVLNNFLTNALKYSSGAPVTVKAVVLDDDHVKISVEDSGIGISADNINKLFERFYRVDDTSMRYQGLGLGLYISSQIVKHHKGRIGVDSTIGEGSRFWFTLPVVPQSNELASIPDPE